MADLPPKQKDLDRDPRLALRVAWEKLQMVDNSVHLYLVARFPFAMLVADRVLTWIYDICAAPAFAIIVALLLVPLVISGAISLITSVSVAAAWGIAVLWIARSDQVRKLTIIKRIAVVLGCAAVIAIMGRWYIRWTLIAYAQHQPQPVIVSTGATIDPNIVAINGLQQAFQREMEELKALKQMQPPQQKQQSIAPVPITPSPLEKLARSLMAERLSVCAGEMQGKLWGIGMNMHGETDQLRANAPPGASTDSSVIIKRHFSDILGAAKQAQDCQSQALHLLPSSSEDKDATDMIERTLSWNLREPYEFDMLQLGHYFGRLQGRLNEASKL
jgi:hypothetical protein